jgi:hypothetical protein
MQAPDLPRGRDGQEKLRKVWRQMRARCEQPRDKSWPHYGARGIRVCPEWATYPPFRAWAIAAGYRDGLTIDRRDNNGPYAPGNCRWIPLAEQNLNYRRNVRLTAFGETKTIKEWADDPRCKVTYAALYLRIARRGWEAERALSTPTIHNNAQATHCPQGHPYSPENTYRDERGWRKCATCVKARVVRWQRQRRGI